MLIEDEHDTVNVIVAPRDHERDRRTVRTELLIVVEGRPERHRAAGGAINVVASRVIALRADDRVLAAQVKDFDPADEIELARRAASGTGDFALVAPPVMNFGAGRR